MAYIGPELVASTDRRERFYPGPPVLAAEILEEDDSEEIIAEILDLYREFGVIA